MLNPADDTSESLSFLKSISAKIREDRGMKKLYNSMQNLSMFESLRSGLLTRSMACNDELKKEFLSVILDITKFFVRENKVLLRCEFDFIANVISGCNFDDEIFEKALDLAQALYKDDVCNESNNVKKVVDACLKNNNTNQNSIILKFATNLDDEISCVLAEKIIDQIDYWNENDYNEFCNYYKSHKCNAFESLDVKNSICKDEL